MSNVLNQLASGGTSPASLYDSYAGAQANTLNRNALNQRTAQQKTQFDQEQLKGMQEQVNQGLVQLVGEVGSAPEEARAQQWQKSMQRISALHPALGKHVEGMQYDPQTFAALEGGLRERGLMAKAAEGYTLSPGSTRFGADGKEIASVPAAPQRPLASDSALVQVADPTSPTGFKYVRRTEAAGMPAPAPRAQNNSKYSPKELEGARGKMRIIEAAKRQLAAVKAARDKLKGAFSSGPFGGGYLPTEDGSNFDGAVDQLRSTIEGLTRTPGIGAQSDFEARLNQAKIPSRNEYESTRDAKIKGLEDLIYGLESGYSDLLSDGQQPVGGQPSAVDPQDLLDAADAILNGQ